MVRRDSTCESEIDRSSFSYNSDEIYYAETASVASSTSTDENCDNGLAVDLSKCNPSFGKISVANSNNVHFGNKTFYHGPVTIKQFLYAADKKLEDSESVVSDNGSVYKISLPNDNPLPINDDCIKPISTNSESKNKEPSENEEGTGWIQSLPRKHVVFVIILSIILVTSLVISTAVLLTRNPISIANGIIGNPSNDIDQEENWGDAPKDNESLPFPVKLQIIRRGEWVAQPPIQPLHPLNLPVPYVIIMHTDTEPCKDEGSCKVHVRNIQLLHIEIKRWWDIGYNFLVGGDSYVYEGREWKSQGYHTYGYDDRSIGIALIGTFNTVSPSSRQIWATKKLIQKGVKMGYIATDYKLVGQMQLQKTGSPGTLLFEEIKSWDHWTDKP